MQPQVIGQNQNPNKELSIEEKYIQHKLLKKTKQNKDGGILYGMYSGVKSFLPSFMKSATPGGDEFRQFFEKRFGKIQHINFRNGTFGENLQSSNKNERAMFLYIHV